MNTIGYHLSFLNLQNFFLKFFRLFAIVVFSALSNYLSASTGEIVKDSTSTKTNIDAQNRDQNQIGSDSQNAIFYVSEGVTVFALHHISDIVEIIQEKPSKTVIASKKAEKKSSIATQSEEKAKSYIKYRNTKSKIYYSTQNSDVQILFSNNAKMSSVFSPNHYVDIDIEYIHYSLSQLKQYDTIFISYESAPLPLLYDHNSSVRPPPFS